ncbi:MAG: proline dehydrogenase family protein [Anaerolineales bacterium]|nr:proline dehydrogenase family protein [Anaerolineales bacterium]
MLRSILIYFSKATWAQNLIMNWGYAWKIASRFVPGTKLEQALQVAGELNGKGYVTSLNQLGEHTHTPDDAQSVADEIYKILDALGKELTLKTNLSIKLTQIGLGLDETLCAEILERILARAKKNNTFIRIDMEDTPYTEKTINLIYAMKAKGYDNVGAVIQAYLYRSEADVRRLINDDVLIRIVKGAYKEPADKAYPNKADTDANYDLLTKILFDASLDKRSSLSADGRIPPLPALATHDEKRVAFAKSYAEKIGLPKNGFEFQMLYGIRRDLQEQLMKDGYIVRVYIPFGPQWYPYFMRRLAERPANVWFFVSNFFRK